MFNFKLIPEQASTFAPSYDWLFWITTLLTVVFTVLVSLILLVLAVRYRQGSKVDRKNPVDHNTFLELSWSGIPLILALVMFTWAARKFVEARTPPEGAMEVFVIGKQWMWHTQHANGVRENNRLTVPVNQPVKLTMISQDVLHSFFIPQFRIKQDVVPGRYTSQWFEATQTGTFNLFCTEYCGTQHSEMGGYVRVLSQEDWERWVANGGDDIYAKKESLADRGKRLFNELKCGSCHGANDNENGPSLNGIVGRTRTFERGNPMVADRDYIRASIKQPYAMITKGYTETMPEYNDMPEDDFLAIYEYIKSLGVQPSVVGTEGAK